LSHEQDGERLRAQGFEKHVAAASGDPAMAGFAGARPMAHAIAPQREQ